MSDFTVPVVNCYITLNKAATMTLNGLTNGYEMYPSEAYGNPPVVMHSITGAASGASPVLAIKTAGGGKSKIGYSIIVSYNLPDGSTITLDLGVTTSYAIDCPTPVLSAGSQYTASYGNPISKGNNAYDIYLTIDPLIAPPS